MTWPNDVHRTHQAVQPVINRTKVRPAQLLHLLLFAKSFRAQIACAYISFTERPAAITRLG